MGTKALSIYRNQRPDSFSPILDAHKAMAEREWQNIVSNHDAKVALKHKDMEISILEDAIEFLNADIEQLKEENKNV